MGEREREKRGGGQRERQREREREGEREWVDVLLHTYGVHKTNLCVAKLHTCIHHFTCTCTYTSTILISPKCLTKI